MWSWALLGLLAALGVLVYVRIGALAAAARVKCAPPAADGGGVDCVRVFPVSATQPEPGLLRVRRGHVGDQLMRALTLKRVTHVLVRGRALSAAIAGPASPDDFDVAVAPVAGSPFAAPAPAAPPGPLLGGDDPEHVYLLAF